VDFEIVLVRGRHADGGDDIIGVGRVQTWRYLADDGEAFLVSDVDGERDAPVLTRRRMARLECLLDVGRNVVGTVDDDDVVQTARDEQFAVVQEAEIPGSQIVGAAPVLQPGSKLLGVCLFAAPVSL
jgi:hypothetical protein